MWLSEWNRGRGRWWSRDVKAKIQLLNRQVSKRQWFTFIEKMAAVWQIEWNIEVVDLSMRAYKMANLHQKQITMWNRILQACMRREIKAKNMFLGPSSILHAFEDQLLHYIFELWEQGMAVSSRLVIVKASSFSREFQERVSIPHYYSVRWIIKCHGLVHQMGMHILQQDPRELEVTVAAFMEMVHPMVNGPSRDKDYIINMD